MYNLNFASNETWSGARQAGYYLWRENLWQTGSAREQLQNYLAKQFEVHREQIAFTLAGRSLLQLLLQELKLPKNTEVLIQAFTCEAVALPIIANQLKPVYVDIEAGTWSMDLADLKKKYHPKARVLILQHSFGMLPKNRRAIIRWAESKNIVVIEDLAHGFDPQVLTNQEKTHKLLSFGRSKFFSSIHGGALILNDKALAQKINAKIAQLPLCEEDLIEKALLYKLLSPLIKLTYRFPGKFLHYLLIKTKIFTREISETERQADYDPWLNRQLPNLFAALILPQLQNYFCQWRQRQKIARFYHRELGGQLLAGNLPCLRYPLLLENPTTVLAKMKKAGYILGDWYRQVVAPVGLDLKKVQYQAASCPNAEKHSREVINLPLNVSLPLAKKIVKKLKEFNAA